MAHTLHLDTFRVQKNEEEKKEEDGKVIEMMYHNPLGSKKGVKKIENISVIEVTLWKEGKINIYEGSTTIKTFTF